MVVKLSLKGLLDEYFWKRKPVKRLLIATTNPGKFSELSLALSDLPIELISLKSIGLQDKPKETGKTFAENARLKANFYFSKTGIFTLADDGGFEIDALNGAPGIQSHRWVDPKREANDEELIAYTMAQMKHLPLEKRGAQLRLVLVFQPTRTEIYESESAIRGIVPFHPAADHTPGFPYRSLLYLPKLIKCCGR